MSFASSQESVLIKPAQPKSKGELNLPPSLRVEIVAEKSTAEVRSDCRGIGGSTALN